MGLPERLQKFTLGVKMGNLGVPGGEKVHCSGEEWRLWPGMGGGLEMTCWPGLAVQKSVSATRTVSFFRSDT
jgi:hypothetical protein